MVGPICCDIYKINGKGCIVMGSGRTMACRENTGKDTEQLNNDFARFNIENGKLIAYADFTFGSPFFTFDPANSPKISIDYFIWMQYEYEPISANVVELTPEEFCKIANPNTEIQNTALIDDKWIELEKMIMTSNQIKFISVPWCDTVEHKGKLVSENIK